MALQISKRHLELLKAYGEESYPNECCGFLLGRQQNGRKEVVSTMPANNAQETKEQHHRFLIRPDVYIQTEKYARERGLDIIGFYHSHPNGSAKPSHFDKEHAWPWYSYVIVAVSNNQAREVASWALIDDRSEFQEEEVVVV